MEVALGPCTDHQLALAHRRKGGVAIGVRGGRLNDTSFTLGPGIPGGDLRVRNRLLCDRIDDMHRVARAGNVKVDRAALLNVEESFDERRAISVLDSDLRPVIPRAPPENQLVTTVGICGRPYPAAVGLEGDLRARSSIASVI